MDKDPNRFWWLSIVLVVVCTGGFSLFEHLMFPASSGLVGSIVGFLLGAALAAVLEDYLDQNLK
jgi:hypothetical protein